MTCRLHFFPHCGGALVVVVGGTERTYMPDITTPFLLTVRGGDRMRLRGNHHEPQSLSFVTALTDVVFTRRLAATTSAPVTVSLVAHCDAAGEEKINGRCFTIATHSFATPAVANLSEEREEEEAAVVVLRSPIVLTSSGPVHSLEVRCAETKRGGPSRGHTTADAKFYAATMHGMQRTALTRAQVNLLRAADNKTRRK
ncbi:hypothetical protein, conserved [Trypanosoma cruzi]|uniref:Uncharacterized protein n=2 Tax=Trypanosoma cruzi TaxID=5693 RepID=Q4DDT0_TRYCC|nr:hypothetical protein, conserved [Trypanosoma cruzi]EAN90685.1 hypothetical protein, conserved [Trypanosoma cruzi]|eukprot:XP_812536.1 hypothetical protein [Trypanosoma cruzi strain CL Brener]